MNRKHPFYTQEVSRLGYGFQESFVIHPDDLIGCIGGIGKGPHQIHQGFNTQSFSGRSGKAHSPMVDRGKKKDKIVFRQHGAGLGGA
jgi:hypothetical protein